MPKITLSEPWPYRTPLTTIEFPAGEHDVSDEVAAAAMADPVAQAALIEQETADGDGIAAPRAPRRSGKAEG